MKLRLRGGPADGTEATFYEGTERICIPLFLAGYVSQALYVVERVNGRAVYAQYVERKPAA